jgi:hypothetical protein
MLLKDATSIKVNAELDDIEVDSGEKPQQQSEQCRPEAMLAIENDLNRILFKFIEPLPHKL